MIEQGDWTTQGEQSGCIRDGRNHSSEGSSAITRQPVMVRRVSARSDLDPTGA